MDIKNPATGEVVEKVPADTMAQVAEKAAKARNAQRDWAQTSFAERHGAIKRFADYLKDYADEAAKILAAEVGKPIRHGRGEVLGTVKRIEWFLEHCEATLSDEEVFKSDGMREIISYEALGTIANISAWNYPYFVGSNVFIPALLAGNAVLYKPSELATLTGRFIVDGMVRAGVPAEVFPLIVGGGDVGASLLEENIAGVFFTGSYATGKKIAEAVAGRMIRTQFELGGKDPSYICDDFDPRQAAESVGDGAFFNSGQSCCAVERIYVHEKTYPAFVDHLSAFAEGLKVGDPLDPDTYIGPLARPQQLDVLEAQIADARERGGIVFTGGKRLQGPGAFFPPTVIKDATNEMSLMREESFGPVIGVQRVKSDEEAVSLMQDTQYGLTASVFTHDASRAQAILKAMNTGTVYWNCCDRVSPHLPWTGRGHSGIGSTLSKVGIRAFTQPKAWHLRS